MCGCPYDRVGEWVGPDSDSEVSVLNSEAAAHEKKETITRHSWALTVFIT